MELAKEWKLLTVDEVLARVTERDLARWAALFKIQKEERDAEDAKRKVQAKSKGR